MTLKTFHVLKYRCLKNSSGILVLFIVWRLISCILTYLLSRWMKEVRQNLLQMNNREG